MQPFEITARDDGAIRVIEVTGEFDLNALSEFREAATPQQLEMVVVDLRETTFLDSHALGALIKLHNRAQEGGFRLAVIRPAGYANRIFSITGADGHLPLYDERVPILAHMNYG